MNHHRHFHYHRRLNDHFLQNLAKKKEILKIEKQETDLFTSLSLSFISCSSSSSSSSSLSCIPRSRSSDKPEYSSYSDGLGISSSCV